jgi:hypothetical protein
MSEGVAWNQGELSEETRKLVLERTEMINHNMAIFATLLTRSQTHAKTHTPASSGVYKP